MKIFSIIRSAISVVFALAAWTRAAEPAPEFAPGYRSGMVLADWRGSAETSVVLRGRKSDGPTVFVRIGSSKEEIETKSEGAEWLLTVKELNDARLVWPDGPCVIEATAKKGAFGWWKPVSPTRRLTNVLIGSVWVVAVSAAAEWSQARENKLTNSLVRFHLGDPTATNGPGWFLSGQPSAPLKPPNIAAHFAEEFLQRGRGEPVGIYLVQQKPPEIGIDEDIHKEWTQVRQTTGAAAARAAGKIVFQASRAERAAFVARSRAAKMQGAVIEGEVPSVEGADFSLRQCGPTTNAWPLFHQIHVHGFLW